MGRELTPRLSPRLLGGSLGYYEDYQLDPKVVS